MSPPDPEGRGGGGLERGALLSGALILAVFWHKYWQLIFIEKGQMTTFLNPIDVLIPFAFFLVFGPHVGPMQTVCPRNGLTEEPHPPLGGGVSYEPSPHGAIFHLPCE